MRRLGLLPGRAGGYFCGLGKADGTGIATLPPLRNGDILFRSARLD